MTPFDFDPSIRVVFGAGTLEPARRPRQRIGRPPRPARNRSRPRPSRPRRTGPARATKRRPNDDHFFRRRRKPHNRTRSRWRPPRPRPRPHQPNRRLGRRQRYGLRQGHQFPADQRRPNAVLPRLRQSRPTHAALHRHPHHRRNGQRGPILRPDYLRRYTNAKMACGDRKARFHIAILDPNVLTSVPQRVRADAGIDALAHAVESYVSTRRTPLSQMFARQAWQLLAPNYEAAVADPQNAADAMLLGAHPSRHCHRKLHARCRPRHRQPPHRPLPTLPRPRRSPDAAARNPVEWPNSGRSIRRTVRGHPTQRQRPRARRPSRRTVCYGRATAPTRRLSGRRKRSTRHGPGSRWPVDRQLQSTSLTRSGFSASFTRRRFDGGKER